jgi:NAD(P)-dependent dehydrogenase (short-subunit alcohol dehydrogenase family)
VTAAGKRVLVVGGETALGRAIAVGLGVAGADVAIASLTATTQAEFAINSALNELWAVGRKGVALAIDATDMGQVRGAVERAEAELGALDAIVAVAEDIAAAELRAAFPEREVLAVAPEADAQAALEGILEILSP